MFLKNKKIIIALLLLIMISVALPVQKVQAACDSGDSGDSKIEGPTWLSQIGIQDGLLIPCGCLSGCIEYNEDFSCKTFKGSKSAQCGFNEVVQVVINFSYLILGIVGSLALIMFIYGGVMFIFSQGNEERITSAKNILKNAALGLLIIFSSWLIINFIIIALGGGDLSDVGKIFGTGWNQP